MANLILYYSRKGENYVSGSIQSLAKGNTERVAEFHPEGRRRRSVRGGARAGVLRVLHDLH